MSRLALRSALRLIAVALAVSCGWVAIATAQKAHAPVCLNPRGSWHFSPAASASFCHGQTPFRPIPVGTTWRVWPTIAMSFAILTALGFGLLAVSSRQGPLLAYRWRRAIY